MSYVFFNKSVFYLIGIYYFMKRKMCHTPLNTGIFKFKIATLLEFVSYRTYWKRASSRQATDQCRGQADGHCRGTQGDPTLAMQFALRGASIANVIMCQNSPQRATLLPFHISWYPDNDDIIAR